MALIRWLGEEDYPSQFDRWQREMERLISSFRPSSAMGAQRTGVYPAMNIYDDGESYIVWAELPGVDPKSLDISVSGDTLTLRGERPQQPVSEKQSYHRRERSYGHFRRALTLPEQVDNTKVMANYKDGVVEIRLPRAEAAKTRKIAVKSA